MRFAHRLVIISVLAVSAVGVGPSAHAWDCGAAIASIASVPQPDGIIGGGQIRVDPDAAEAYALAVAAHLESSGMNALDVCTTLQEFLDQHVTCIEGRVNEIVDTAGSRYVYLDGTVPVVNYGQASADAAFIVSCLVTL